MARQDPLSTYNRKRDFSKTAEPAGRVARGRRRALTFMVQKHGATRLHYDFRLELAGVLKSWAVTRGPSLDPADNRLAVRTEDHPMSYATFEGTIPKGEYGGGTVMLWDRGTWTPEPGKDPHETLKKGHLHFALNGERMKGEWVMFRLKPKPKERHENWILKKVDDDFAGSSTGLTDVHLTSVKTGRTLSEIAEGKKTRPSSRRRPGSRSQKSQRSPGDPGLRRGDGRLPKFRPIQKATLVDHVPTGAGWLHEMKYDGYRCLLAVARDKVRIYTRTGLDWTDKFPEIAAAAIELDIGSALLDGEIVKLDAHGNTNFSALQAAIGEGGHGLTLFLFDALEVDGKKLDKLPAIERKQQLAALIGDGAPPFLLYADHIVGRGERLYDAMCKAGQEGIISKKADAPYRGARTKTWLKIKCTNRQELVIIGWTPSDKKGRGFRSLLLALHEDGKLRYAGKVGTGFSVETQSDLGARFEKLKAAKAPVEVPRSEARGAQWVKPKLVAEIAFGQFTADHIIRHASFLGLRGDKPAKDVVKEAPQAMPDMAEDDVRISNPDRVIFPEAKVTKGQLADYYRKVGALMLPWTANRPVSLVRCPQGRARKCFFQKHDSGSFGEHVKHVPIREKDGKTEDYLYVEDSAGLVACVQMGTIEFHGWGSKVSDIEKPDRIIFDLDPDEGLGFDKVKKAAHDLRRHLADIGLTTFPMLTGGKGVHVVVPLAAEAKWPAVKDFAQRFALALAEAEPGRFTATLSKAQRKGKIFIDYLRNQRGSTAIMPYSARAREQAPVAAPINWDELDGYDSGGHFTVKDAEELVERAASRALRGWGDAAQTLPDV
ncbi:DNA ligase D [Sphingosinicella sp. LHD-64]|uniref:DNA ligase D n=1 Tax=Sphingosinicella sp. LHD-64 TaxID=3072139 RepID=UPI00280C8B57|nr:DNA ligase D [Sphingosinicella sp. LHD-64]MDQ8754929.1 DNA ligase D [Sphingosinicella sp. LHD-64]